MKTHKKTSKGKCVICSSEFVDIINDKIFHRVRLADIMVWAAFKGLTFSRSTLERHKRLHYKKNVIKLVDEKKLNEKLTTKQLDSLTDFLDLIVEKVNVKIKSGKIVPTVAEAVKAAEIKVKMKEDTKFEKELVKFFMNVSKEYGAAG